VPGQGSRGANVPFAHTQPGPTQKKQGWDWCSGYHYSDSVLVGFGQMHLSGTGIGDLGDIALLPVTKNNEREVKFSHKAEYATPGYYAVTLANGVRVELTATQRTAFHRYTFPADVKQEQVVLDLSQGIGWDKMTKSAFKQNSPTEVSGYRYSTGWAKDQRVYFVAQFSRPVTMATSQGDSLAVLSTPNNDEPLLVKVGISPVSEDNARANIAADLGLAENCVNIKGKTNEKLGYLGRMEGIEAQAVVLLEKVT